MMKIKIDLYRWSFLDFQTLTASFESSDFDKAAELTDKVLIDSPTALNDMSFDEATAIIKTVLDEAAKLTEILKGEVPVNLKAWRWKDFNKWQKAAQSGDWETAIPLMLQVTDGQEEPLSFVAGIKLFKSVADATTKVFSAKN